MTCPVGKVVVVVAVAVVVVVVVAVVVFFFKMGTPDHCNIQGEIVDVQIWILPACHTWLPLRL